MSNRLSPEKAKAIAAQYINNGYDKVKTLLDCGYSPSYARTVGLRLYDNVSVKAAIASIQGKTALKCDITRESQLKDLEKVKTDFIRATNPAAYVAACKEQNKMLGYHRELAPNEEKEAKRRARMDLEKVKMAEIAAKKRLEDASAEATPEQGQAVIERIMSDKGA